MEKPRSALLRFGRFELDARAGVLRKEGRPVKIAPQPWRVLEYLASRPGELVGRQELIRHVWGDSVNVNYDAGLASAIRQVRAALRDQADSALFIETVPRRGYRFVAPVQEASNTSPEVGRDRPESRRGRGPVLWLALTSGSFLLFVLVASATGVRRDEVETMKRLQQAELELRVGNAAAVARAVGLFREVLRLDPSSTEARAGLAQSLLERGFYEVVPMRTAIEDSCAELETVGSEGDGLSRTWALRGRCRWLLDRDWEAARTAFERAVQLDMNDAYNHQLLAWLLSGMGEHEAAIDVIRKATTVAPYAEGIHRSDGWIHFFARKHAEAAVAFQRSLDSDENRMLAHHGLFETYRQLGEAEQAVIHAQSMLGPAGAPPDRIAEIVTSEDGAALLDRWWNEAIEAGHRVPAVETAVMALRGGDTRSAVRILKQGIEDLESGAFMIGVDPRLDPLREDAEFLGLVQTVRRSAS